MSEKIKVAILTSETGDSTTFSDIEDLYCELNLFWESGCNIIKIEFSEMNEEEFEALPDVRGN